MPEIPPCPRCDSEYGQKAGSVLSPRGRVQRYLCLKCGKKFHISLKARGPNDYGRMGFLDIEASQLTATFGILFSWAIKPRGGRGRASVQAEVLKARTLAAERQLLNALLEALKAYDTVVTYYGSRFDIPFIRTRCLFHGLPFPRYLDLYHLDLYYVVRNRLKLHSNRLAVAAEHLGIKGKTPVTASTWAAANMGEKWAFEEILKHNIGDVVVLEKVYKVLEPFMRPTRTSI
ncbi:MAG: ribonuclease H-like domain-containing protein [Armatimonadota bacterium]|nr:ribonuclease H-like domain-containing protein [Armatimonadota bacterium]